MAGFTFANEATTFLESPDATCLWDLDLDFGKTVNFCDACKMEAKYNKNGRVESSLQRAWTEGLFQAEKGWVDHFPSGQPSSQTHSGNFFFTIRLRPRPPKPMRPSHTPPEGSFDPYEFRVATRPGNPENVLGFYFVLEMSWEMTHFQQKVLERSLNFQIKNSKFINLKICFPCR